MFAVTATLLSSTLLPGDAFAYLVVSTVFADGSDSALLSFSPTNLSLEGPRLRLLTNSTITATQLSLEGSLGTAEAWVNRSGDADFAAADALEHLGVAGGALQLENTTSALRFDANNSFGGGQLGGFRVQAGRLVTFLGGWISYSTLAITNTGGGWGYFSADGGTLGNDWIKFDLIGGGGAVVVADIQPGARIPFTSWEQPSLIIRVNYFHPIWAKPSPYLNWFAIGQRAHDGLYDPDGLRTSSNLSIEEGIARTLPEPATWSKDATNPIIPRQAGTYRAGFVAQPVVLRVGSEWWMYFAASSEPSQQDADIARAVSTDLENWTVDAAPLLYNGSGGVDSFGVGYPFVMPDPSGSGFIMFYTGWTNATAASIVRAASPDGLNWTKTGQALGPLGSPWKAYAVGMVSRVDPPAYSGGGWTMWFSGTDDPSGAGYVLARAVSSDGASFDADYGFNPSLVGGGPGSSDEYNVMGGSQVILGGMTYYYYTCDGTNGRRICLANSSNGWVWDRVGAVLNSTNGTWDSMNVSDPSVILTESAFHLFYSGLDANGSQIGGASAPFKAATLTGRMDLIWGNDPDLSTFHEDYFNPRLGNDAGTYYASFIGEPSIVRFNGSYSMYLTAGNQTGYQGAAIALATSTNLFDWSLRGASVLLPDATMNDSWAAASPFVMIDPVDGGLRMYYTGYTYLAGRHLMMATSQDGTNWTKQGDVLWPTAGAWDSRSVGNVSHVDYNFSTGLWRMWYSGTADPRGGANSIGLALSTDGSNWTKYAANPVLQREGIDSQDLQGGKMLRVDGTLYLYYSCSDGVYRVCMASSNDGTNWSKAGAVFWPGGTGFESVRVSSACPVADGSNLRLFYTAVGSNGLTQIGRATGVFNPQGPRPRLSDLPRAIAGLDVDLVAGVPVNVSIRSSNDLANWTLPENITLNSAVALTPPRRYIEYTVAFEAGFVRSALDSVGLRLVAAHDNGRWVDANLSFGDPFDQLVVGNAFRGPGAALYRVSADGGATWHVTSVGRILAIDGSLGTLAVEVRLLGDSSGILEYERFDARARAYGFPANLSVSIAGSGPLSVQAGTLNGSVTVALPTERLNGAIQAALAANASAPFVDVPLAWNSTHFGVLNLTGLVLEFSLRNPLSTSFAPSEAALTVAEAGTLEFTVEAHTIAGVPIAYSWTVDGALFSNAGPSFNYTPGYFDAGSHWVNVTVENGDFARTHSWAILVLNVNRAPRLLEAVPPSPLTASHASAIRFRVSADDPDLEVLGYTWWVDGTLQAPFKGNETEITGLVPGTHEIVVEVNDSQAWLTTSWSLSLTNAAPFLAEARGPTGTINRSDPPAFRVWTTDADGDAVRCEWTIDGTPLLATSANATTLLSKPSGSHNVSVSCGDGFASLVYMWAFTAQNAHPTIESASGPTGEAGYLSILSFLVDAHDADGDALAFTWTVNGHLSGASTPTLTMAPGAPGDYLVTATIDDGIDMVFYSWNVKRINMAPVIVSRTPDNGSAPSVADSFLVEVADEDNATLSYLWQLDDIPAGHNRSTFEKPGALQPGVHELRLIVTDAFGATASANWTFIIPPPPSPEGAGLAILMIVGLAAVAAAVLLARRQRRTAR